MNLALILLLGVLQKDCLHWYFTEMKKPMLHLELAGRNKKNIFECVSWNIIGYVPRKQTFPIKQHSFQATKTHLQQEKVFSRIYKNK